MKMKLHVKLILITAFFASDGPSLFQGWSLVNASHPSVTYMWMAGQKEVNETMMDNSPGSRSGSSSWQDKETVWFFGGLGFQNKQQLVLMNDLWKHSISHHQWYLIHQTSKKNENESSHEPLIPPPRQLSVMCGVHDKMLIVYGGIDGSGRPLGDVWLYRIKDNKWSLLDKTKPHAPSPRADPAAWCFEDKLVIFGGLGDNEVLQDQWILSYNDFAWKEVSESKKYSKVQMYMKGPVYPAGRSGATTWKFGGLLYMFGGDVQSKNLNTTQYPVGYTSDIWNFNINSQKWTFVSGHREPNQPGHISWYTTAIKENNPGCRRKGAAWVDSNGDLWLFGGQGIYNIPQPSKPAPYLSDLWIFRRRTEVWAIYGGYFYRNPLYSEMKKWGLQDQYFPAGRTDMVYWKKENTNILGFYGGQGRDSLRRDGYLSDMWLIDVNSSMLPPMTANSGTVLFIVFVFMASVTAMVTLLLYSRKFYGNIQNNYYKSVPSSDELP